MILSKDPVEIMEGERSISCYFWNRYLRGSLTKKQKKLTTIVSCSQYSIAQANKPNVFRPGNYGQFKFSVILIDSH